MAETEKYNPQILAPYGLVVTRSWLLSKGIKRHTLDNWIKSGQLSSLAYGVYKKPDTKVTWEGIVCSLQYMCCSDLCPGGVTALALQGLGHYSELGKHKTIHLYGRDALPTWINKLLTDVAFVRHNEGQLFNKSDFLNLDHSAELSWGLSEWPLRLSSPEKAFFEALLDVPDTISFEYADQLMQGLVNLSPRRLNKLLEHCTSIKVRRLFLWFAERHQHAWLKKTDVDCYTMESGLLGSGKRMLAKGGKLDEKYMITVPEEMHG
ncbi:MAG: hypothetical protein CO093_07995 [Alphaproteobacteria bacterium CG_4_9_14_3_um_filter_47_13]|nr:MAG: hypothetical protein CO093_07995 [Alphaproteobacteria bacterium CG_4_9_14_3_um_filter_47_13]